ncbi:hypothetical protein GGP92_003091 [Salinibacter ruber]|nr:hypothetical protein [Salinibacter ruber]
MNEKEFSETSELADKVSRQLDHLIRHLESYDGSEQVRELSAEYVAQ